MKFQFNVNISDQDYFDYNIFWALKSPYGKKQITSFRVVFTIIYGICIFISFLGRINAETSITDAVIGIIPMLAVLILIEILLIPFYKWGLKGHIKSLNKTGKKGYIPSSVMEFYDDYFIDITTENKVEQKYSVVERISIVDNKMIYIHVNNIMAHILPVAVFESAEQYNSFLNFIKTKCENIDIY